MRFVELIVVMVAAAALVLWRGVAIYRQTFQRKDL
jgi:hypothetical protein